MVEFYDGGHCRGGHSQKQRHKITPTNQNNKTAKKQNNKKQIGHTQDQALKMLRKGIQNICASRHAMTSVRSMSTVTAPSTVTLPKSVGVIGAGQMGSGIAYVSAVNAKIPVLIMDPNATQLTNSVKHISRYY